MRTGNRKTSADSKEVWPCYLHASNELNDKTVLNGKDIQTGNVWLKQSKHFHEGFKFILGVQTACHVEM